MRSPPSAAVLLLAALSAGCKVPFTAECKAGEEICKPCPACGADELCLRGQCLPRSCSAAEPCHAGYACLSGRCVNGSCLGVFCPAGEACANGACYPADCTDQDCSPSEVCDGSCKFSGCAGVTCPLGEACADGTCTPVACDGVACATGSVCHAATGACVDTRCVGVLCGEGLTCWKGACVDAVPEIAVTAPNGGADFTTNARRQTVSGTCSADTVSLKTSKGAFADSDCRDGTWSLRPLDLATGENLFTVTARNAPGGEATATIRLTYDPPPEVEVLLPDNDEAEDVYERTTTVSGTCSKDVVELTTSLGTVADGDCSDGKFSLAPFPLDQLGPYRFEVAVRDSFGSTAKSHIVVTFAYVRLENGASAVYRRDNPTPIAGRCCSEVANLTVSAGTLVDADCGDGTFSVLMGFDQGDGKYPLTATGSSATVTESDSLDVVYDTLPPVSTVDSSKPASPNASNFPVFHGTTEPGAMVQLYSDPACTVAVSRLLNSWEADLYSASGDGITVPVLDGTTSTIYARALDRAGNLGPCSTSHVDYTDTTAGLPACDVTVTGPTLTFAELQRVLDDAQARRAELLGDGAVAVCLADGVLVSTRSQEEGGRLWIPGNDFYLFAPTGRATLANLRTDELPEFYDASETLKIVGMNQVGLANLAISAVHGTALAIENSKVAFLRNLEVTGEGTKWRAVDLYSDSNFVFLAELSDSVLTAQTAFHARTARIRQVRGTTFNFLSGAGISLDNSSIVLSELLDSTLSANHPTAAGTGLRIFSANRNVSIEKMVNNVIRRGPEAAVGTSGTAISFAHWAQDRTYVRTPNVTGNVVCAAGAGSWKTLLDPGGQPTVPYDPVIVKGTNGAKSFPWGAAGEAAANPGFNLQKQWGGACP